MDDKDAIIADLLRRIEALEQANREKELGSAGVESIPLPPRPTRERDGSVNNIGGVPRPFNLEIDQSDVLNIYLPPGSCYYGGKEVEYPEDLDENHILPIPQCTEEVWGIITKSGGESSEVVYKLSFANEKSSDENTVVSFLVAVLGDDEDLDSDKYQVLNSAIAFGGAGGASADPITIEATDDNEHLDIEEVKETPEGETEAKVVGYKLGVKKIEATAGVNSITTASEIPTGAGDMEIESAILDKDVVLCTRYGSGLIVRSYLDGEDTETTKAVRRIELDIKGHFGDHGALAYKHMFFEHDSKGEPIGGVGFLGADDIDFTELLGKQITATGTDGIEATGKEIKFHAAEGSNVSIECRDEADGAVHVYVGVYWKDWA